MKDSEKEKSEQEASVYSGVSRTDRNLDTASEERSLRQLMAKPKADPLKNIRHSKPFHAGRLIG